MDCENWIDNEIREVSLGSLGSGNVMKVSEIDLGFFKFSGIVSMNFAAFQGMITGARN